MRVYVPSWNGDFRLEPEGDEKCVLLVTKPTPAEKEILGKFLTIARDAKWTEATELPKVRWGKSKLPLSCGMAEPSAELIRLTRPEARTITAVRFSSGHLEIVEGTNKTALVETVAAAEKEEKATGKEAAAASVKRPTISCPACIPGAIEPATEVLLEFLTPEQHEDWARDRMIVVEGGRSGHRYLVSHRHAKQAQRWGRNTFDVDDQGVMHFHDWSHPPEEEVLAVKLILEHREAWLRNEGSCFAGTLSGRPFRRVYKNPFGDILDGVADAGIMQAFGGYAQSVVELVKAGADRSDYDPLTGLL